jgi:molybdopterin-guanine dinucleotide biosynthesis protein B
MTIPVLSIVGRSKVGKTTLLEKLIPELKRRGYHVATIKHHSHPGFEIDKPGKDTWRHAQAGSAHVILAAPDRIASIRNLNRELSLDEILAEINASQSPSLPKIDLILTEGYKSAGKPALEIVRSEISRELICDLDQLVAVAADLHFDLPIPQFGLDETARITDFIQQNLLKPA